MSGKSFAEDLHIRSVAILIHNAIFFHDGETLCGWQGSGVSQEIVALE